jgi:hypothetical protein
MKVRAVRFSLSLCEAVAAVSIWVLSWAIIFKGEQRLLSLGQDHENL